MYTHEHLPFYSYNHYLQKLFGERVYKVSVDAGFYCPNRDGLVATGGCIFCDESGSSSLTRKSPTMTIREQILSNIRARSDQEATPKKFIVYFQSYTNTYGSVQLLKEKLEEAIHSDPNIVGVALSTRADSIDEAKLQLLQHYRRTLPYICVEYGMQSIYDQTLKRLNRGETHEHFLQACKLHQQKFPEIDFCAHVLLNAPGEERFQQLAMASYLANLGVPGVKIHLLTALEGTLLARDYHQGRWLPLTFQESVALIADFLERLHPTCVIHRIAGHGHPKQIVAPTWIKEERDSILHHLLLEFNRRKSCQGRRF
ncbi:MAG: TIGR01212 family radical SAM protein [Oligoflexia bacterium]|nr:TIGR01212 family radical SAM protein [Oligoflexia bacterium]